MTLTAKVNGIDYASDRVRMRDANEQGIQGLPASANGGGSQGGIIFDDPDGTFVHQGWQYVEVDESACTAAPRLCTGYLGDRTERRGKYRDGAGREIDATINDINVLLSLRLIDGTDGKRPQETRAVRVAWIMGSDYLDGLVEDLGLLTSADGQVFEEADFRGGYASQVFDSISSGSIFFAYWDQTAEAVGVFFDLPTATAYTSTLTISNDLSDCGPLDDPGTTCFPPYVDGEQRIDPSDVHSKHRLTWVGGVTVRNNATTASTFFPSPLLTRGVQEDSSRIGKLTTAITYTDAQLLRASVERTTVTCTMRLPKTKIGLIDAGHRIFAKFTHLSGFETGAYTRVEEKSIVQTDGTREYYDLALVLSTSGLEGGRAGGGGTDGFPAPPPTVLGPCGPSATYLHVPSGTSVSPESITATAGQYIYVLRTAIDVTWLGTSNWSLHLDTNTATDPQTGAGGVDMALLLTHNGFGTWGHSIGTWTSPDDTPPAAMHVPDVYPSQTGFPFRPVAGGYYGVIAVAPATTIGPLSHSIPAGTYHLRAGNVFGDGFFGASGYTGNVCLVVSNDAPTSFISPSLDSDPVPPQSGQWVYGEVLTMAGAVGTTDWPYAAGSPKVRVDGVLISPASYTETDPAAGTITLSWTPDTDEVVTIDYQAI